MSEPFESKDEAFWRKQERRREKQLGQPCCTQSGMSWSMIDMPGNFAVVIHGEFDCVNCFHHHVGQSAVNYYSTRLTEEMLTTGRTEEALRTCLELIAEEQRPDVVVVLGTCPVEVIGDRFGPIVEEISAKTGVPMVPLRTSGLALSSQRQMLDWLFKTLASLPPTAPIDRAWQREVALLGLEAAFATEASPDVAMALRERLQAVRVPGGDPSALRVNLVGMPSSGGLVPEPIVLLAGTGIEVNGVFPEGASVSEWRAIRHARHAFVADRTMFPRLLGVLEEFGQVVDEVPLPIGLESTRSLYRAIGRATAREAEVEKAIEPFVARAEAACSAFRRRWEGVRLGVTLRMLNNYRADVLAYDGLGELAALRELGFDVELLVQGPPEDDARAAFRATLEKRGCTLPFKIFPGPYALADLLRAGRYDLCIVADSSRDAAHSAGVPMLSTRGLGPWLAAVPSNADLFDRALSENLARRT